MTTTGSSPSPTFRDEDDRKSVVLGRLRLEFAWTGDRWAHALHHHDDAHGSAPLVRSIEGGDAPDPARVVSPAYQQFHWHDEPAGHGRAMLVGMSGPHHFSAVFAPEAQAGGGVALDVDVADRCRAEVAFFAATFLVERTSGDLRAADASRIVWSVGDGALVFEAGPGTILALDEAGRRATRVQALAAIDPAAATLRCVYRWRFLHDLAAL